MLLEGCINPLTLRAGDTKNRRTTLTVVAGFTCCSPQPGWPDKGTGQKAEGKGGTLRRAGPLVTWGQALEGESSSVLTLWPGDANPFLGLRFLASTAASGPRSRHLA